MSSVYLTEPPTNGKVVIRTTLGDIDIELWSKEAPKACRSFVQLALEGYFDGCIFHRVIPNLLVQTGDPTGTGVDGRDVYDGDVNFAKEIHSRLKFNHRGQVAMAAGQGSQFFISLDRADWLGGKHCIFGKVTGTTIYNLMRIGELETDKSDRPLDPPIIRTVEVLASPFDDIVIRPTSKAAVALASGGGATASKPARVGKKASHLLSFSGPGEEDDDDDGGRPSGRPASKAAASSSAPPSSSASPSAAAPPPRRGILSAHEAAAAASSSSTGGDGVDSGTGMLASGADHDMMDDEDVAVSASRGGGSTRGGSGTGGSSGGGGREEEEEEEGSSSRDFAAAMRARISGKLHSRPAAAVNPAAAASASSSAAGSQGASKRRNGDTDDGDASYVMEEEDVSYSKRQSKAADAAKQARLDEFKRLQEEVRASKRAVAVAKGAGVAAAAQESMDKTLLTPLQAMRAKYQKRKRDLGDRESQTLAKLAAFQKTLKTVVALAPAVPPPADDEQGAGARSGAGDAPDGEGDGKEVGYHGQVLEDDDEDDVGKSSSSAAGGTASSAAPGGDGGGKEQDKHGWMATRLHFKQHIDDKYKGFGGDLGSRRMDDQPVDDGMITIDPRAQGTSAAGLGVSAGGGGGGFKRARDELRPRQRWDTNDDDAAAASGGAGSGSSSARWTVRNNRQGKAAPPTSNGSSGKIDVDADVDDIAAALLAEVTGGTGGAAAGAAAPSPPSAPASAAPRLAAGARDADAAVAGGGGASRGSGGAGVADRYRGDRDDPYRSARGGREDRNRNDDRRGSSRRSRSHSSSRGRGAGRHRDGRERRRSTSRSREQHGGGSGYPGRLDDGRRRSRSRSRSSRNRYRRRDEVDDRDRRRRSRSRSRSRDRRREER